MRTENTRENAEKNSGTPLDPEPFPFFAGVMEAASFRPAWVQEPNSWVGHIPFASWLLGSFPARVFVELGTHTGNSYFSFCQAAKEKNLAVRCFAVDTWEGDPQAGFYQGDVFEMVNAHNQKNYERFSVLLKKTFDAALQDIEDASVDLLHIDGLHTYDAVRHDFTTWLPKLAPGAVVIFHDICEKEEGFGVWKFWEELKQEYPQHLEFEQSHGLGVLRVGSSQTSADFSWLVPGTPKAEAVRRYFTALGFGLLEKSDAELAAKRIAEQESFIAGLSSRADLANSTIERMKNSWSWKITAPCRWVQHALGGK